MWKTQKLSDVIEKGETINPTTNPDTKFSYIDVSSVDRVSFRISETQTLLGKDAPSRARRAVKTGDVLFATIRPTLQRVAIVPEKLNGEVCSTGYIVLRPKASIICSKFIFYYMLSEKVKAEMEGLQTGASYPAVNDTQVKNLHISYPPLAEQQRIVAKLDAAFAEIDAAIVLQENKLEEIQRYFGHVVDYNLKKLKETVPSIRLGEVLDSVQYGTSTKCEKTGRYPVLRMGNMQNGRFNIDDLVYLNDDAEAKKYSVNAKDVFFNRTNSPLHVGKAALLDEDMEALFAGYLIRLNYDRKKIDGQFLAYYLNAPSIRQYGYSVMTSSVNQANINGSKLKEYPFIGFDFQTQQKIATHFSQLEFNIIDIKQLIEKNIKNYRALVSAILAQELQSEAA